MGRRWERVEEGGKDEEGCAGVGAEEIGEGIMGVVGK